MSRAIKCLKLRSFRGATQPMEIEFDTAMPLVVLFGESGCGKSSLVDAIDFVVNRTFGSLVHRSVDGPRHPFLASIGQNPADIEVEVETEGGGSRAAKLVNRQVSVSGTGDMPIVRVLRRAEIPDIVEATPAERYKALGRFIDVSEYESCENKLRDAHRTSAGSLDRAAARVEQASNALENYWLAEGAPEEDARVWAKAKASEDIADLTQQKTSLKAVLDAMAVVSNRRRQYAKAVKKKRSADRTLARVQHDLSKAPAVQGADAVGLVELLQKASALVGDGAAISECPLCLQQVEGQALRESIVDRLGTLDEYVQLASRRESAQRQAALSESSTSEARSSLRDSFQSLVEASVSALRELDRDSQAKLDVIRAALETDEETLQVSTIRDGRTLCRNLAPLSSSLSIVSADLEKHNAISLQYDELLNTEKAAARHEEVTQHLKRALEVVEKTRKDFVESVLNSIGEECKALYARIHPEEDLGSPHLSMHEDRRGSVKLGGVFGNESDVPPQGYYSESHLDTLGFCVWLAISKRGAPEHTVLLIDDVFTSVDAQHLSRIVCLISDVAEEFAQVIVTTHYRNWRNRYRLAHAPGLKAQLLELHRWTLARGITLSSTKLAVEELEAMVDTEPLRRQAVASQAGILLEALLDYLTLLYRRRLPRTQEGEWTLGELLSACRKLAGNLSIERDETPSSDDTSEEAEEASDAELEQIIAPFYEEMGQLWFVRNQVGCHFNLAGGEISDEDVRAFGKATIALVRAIACKECGHIPSRRKGDHFACACNKTRMKPLEYTG